MHDAGADSVHSDSVIPTLDERHQVILYALLSLVLVVGGHHTWRQYHRYVEATTRRARIQRLVETSRREAKANAIPAEVTVSSSSKIKEESSEQELAATAPEAASAESLDADDALTAKQPKRSKERRRRGRDVYKDVLKNEKDKGKVPAGRPPTSNSPMLATALLQPDDALGSPAQRSTSLAGSSRSSSSARPISEYEPAEDTPRPASVEWSAHHDTRSDYSSMSESVSSLGVGTKASSHTSEEGKTLADRLSPHNPPLSTPVTAVAGEPSDHAAISQPKPSASPSDSQNPPWASPTPSSPTRTHASTAVHENRFNQSSPPRFRSVSRSTISSPSRSASVSVSAQSPCPTPPPASSLQAQIASYKGALEASRRREERYRREVDKFKQECEMLRFHWNQDAEKRKRREAELEAQVQHVTSQFQSLTLSVSHMQVQGFQNSYSAHSPMPLGYPSPGVLSPNSGPMPLAQHPYSIFQNDPHMRFRSASSSNVASPTHEASRPAFINDVNIQLAEAILKRPERVHSSPSESLSELSYTEAGSVAGGSRSGSVMGRATRDGFTFASLSELGNPQPWRSALSSSDFGDDVDERDGNSVDYVSHDTDRDAPLDRSANAPDDSARERANRSTLAHGDGKGDLEAFAPMPIPMECRSLSAPGWQQAASDNEEAGEPDDSASGATMERAVTYGEEGRKDRYAYGSIATA